jgi:xylulose-5-phosphate/fructose-6-phosphate phosphoketolase
LAFDAIRRVKRFAGIVERERQRLEANHQRHKEYVMEHGVDLPEVEGWRWK